MAEGTLGADIAPAAYRLFMEESGSHLRWMSELLEADRPLAAHDLKEAQRRFHMMRGGAGFFGFDRVAQTARTLEDLLRYSQDEQVVLLDRIASTLKQLQQAVAELPHNLSGLE